MACTRIVNREEKENKKKIKSHSPSFPCSKYVYFKNKHYSHTQNTQKGKKKKIGGVEKSDSRCKMTKFIQFSRKLNDS